MSGNRQLTLALLIVNQKWPTWWTSNILTFNLNFFNHNIWFNKLKKNFAFKLSAIAIALKTMSDDVRQPATNGISFYTKCQSKWLSYFIIFNHNIWLIKLNITLLLSWLQLQLLLKSCQMRSGNRQPTVPLCILIVNQNDWPILFTNF